MKTTGLTGDAVSTRGRGGRDMSSTGIDGGIRWKKAAPARPTKQAFETV